MTASLRVKRWRERHPDRIAAQRKTAWAIESGRLVPQPCERCGTAPPTQAHHPDYARPYDVIWLCRPCHYAEHRGKHQGNARIHDLIPRVRALRADGMSFGGIAKNLGVSKTSVQRWCK